MSFEVMDATPLPFGIPVLINMTANCRKRNMKAYAVYQGKDVQYKMKIDKLDKGRFHLTFKPKDEGIYYIHVLNGDKELPRSPLTVCCIVYIVTARQFRNSQSAFWKTAPLIASQCIQNIIFCVSNKGAGNESRQY